MDSNSLFNRVLLIEDDSSHALLVKRALKTLVSTVEHCTSMPDAIRIAASFAPDLIISDLNLGSDVAVQHFAELQQATAQTPIIVLTASTSLTDAVEAMRKGARDFIVKNFDRDFAEILGFSLSRLAAALHLEGEQRRLQQQLQILQVAIENSADGLAVADSHGNVSYHNSAFEKFITRSGGELSSVKHFIGKQVKDGEAAQRLLSEQFEALEIGGVFQTEISFHGEKDFGLDLSLLHVEDKVVEGLPALKRFVFLARDITEQRKRQRFQREILSTTTHDLKGPLGAIMTSSELIPQFITDPHKVEQLALRVGSSARTALNLIEEFLSARRIQEGSFILHPKQADLAAITSEAVADFSNMAMVRGIKLIFNPHHDACLSQVDTIGFSRVVSNLISNAIKFTPKGGTITVSLLKDAATMSLRIQDTGSGMEPSEVKQLFGRFSRLERHQEIGGTGLGLFVVKAIVSAHGGTINVTSAVGKGTTFEITIPQEPPVNERGELFCLDFD
jgi:signal transduction histidine kinase